MPYTIHFYAACGMHHDVEFDELPVARQIIARRLTRLRSEGYTVDRRVKGRAWEITEPEDAVMVPDDAGMMTLLFEYEVTTWEERDNLVITLKLGDDEIAEWRDDEAREMFEDGLFDGRRLKESVIKYAKHVGLIKES